MTKTQGRRGRWLRWRVAQRSNVACQDEPPGRSEVKSELFDALTLHHKRVTTVVRFAYRRLVHCTTRLPRDCPDLSIWSQYALIRAYVPKITVELGGIEPPSIRL